MPTRTDANLPIDHSAPGATIARPAMVPDTLMLGVTEHVATVKTDS